MNFLSISENNKVIFELDNGSIIENIETSYLINGENNTVKIKLPDENSVKQFIQDDAVKIDITGFNNNIEIDNPHFMVNNRMLDIKAPCLKIFIGGAANPLVDKDEVRYANNCAVKIGKDTTMAGVRMYLQDDNSKILIGNNCMLSFGIDIWCTDTHTITDLEGNPLNFGKSIEVGHHVWIGMDVKIGKNTKISENSIIGWGSVVTKKFDETNVVIAGNPAKIVKQNINWNGRDLNNYLKHYKGE